MPSRAEAERALAAGAVRVDGAARPKSYRLEPGQTVEFELPERAARMLEPEAMDLRVAYEDEHVIVVDKPGHHAGTLVHGLLELGAEGGEEADRPGIVHRLDRDTSGLLVVARSEEAYERLKQQVANRELERTYLALVRGRPRSRRGRIEAPIGRDRHDPMRHSLDTGTPRDPS